MSRFIRASKYRHVYGEKAKERYDNVKITGSAWDTDLVSASATHLAINWQAAGGGAFVILPTFSAFSSPAPAGFPTKLPDILPLARGHTAPVLDTAWSPFDDDLVVSAGDDGKIFIWKVENGLFDGWGEEGWEPQDLEPKAKLDVAGRKVGQVLFHPTASNVLTSASGDHIVRLWDIEKGSDSATIQLEPHKDSIQGLCWNPTGTLLATTCRDRKLRLFDPRSGGDPVRITDGHSGVKGSRVVWLGDRDRIATTGFSRMSDREVSVWDTGSLNNLKTDSIDTSSGVLMPFFLEGNDILFLAGKGDGNIRYYEYENDTLHYLNEYKSSDPQRGMTFLPRRALDVGQHEIGRAFKLAGGGVEPLSFIVPRKAENFQSDIFPPATSSEAALSGSDWFGGKDARPKVVDLQTKAVSTNSTPIASTPKKAAPTKTQSEPIPKTPTPAREPSPSPVNKTETAAAGVAAAGTAGLTAAATVAEAEKPKDQPVEAAKDLEIEQPDSEDEAPAKSPVEQKPAASTSAPSSGAKVTAPTDTLLVKRLSDKATVPTRGSPLSAGYDLYSAEDIQVPGRGKALVDLQISIACPEGTYGRVAPRSGLASKHSIDTGAGVIDADYRGPVKVLLYNHSDTDFEIKTGDRIAQLILERVAMVSLQEVDDLEATSRGAGGFGSTGGFGAK
ncbi:hypothetical protein BD324DRAFT_633486 [Kockovaella imperatae]|uniref:Coronin n=1 Tax=Kockovaella imperatae TaxID=4999 RepID=A0A1Y1UAA3_9TREE|nr:hypothetical protein BD324DRAFT_633486 [Kockovaella imperatae]ORX34981.1 hypothetical protein BD324DRAFT_633486 [Kockovaella imperatae]